MFYSEKKKPDQHHLQCRGSPLDAEVEIKNQTLNRVEPFQHSQNSIFQVNFKLSKPEISGFRCLEKCWKLCKPFKNEKYLYESLISLFRVKIQDLNSQCIN